MRGRVEFSVALLAQLIGAGAVLLLATREWQTVTTARPRPYPPVDVLGLSGRTVDAAPTAFALVALAGVVAVLATKGTVRRAIGALVALAGVGLIWRSAAAIGAVSAARARDLVHEKHPRVTQTAVQVTTHPVWGALSVAAAVLVIAAGVAIAVRGGRWAAMSARYERPVVADPDDAVRARARADASLWSALERGEDPTAHHPQDSP